MMLRKPLEQLRIMSQMQQHGEILPGVGCGQLVVLHRTLFQTQPSLQQPCIG